MTMPGTLAKFYEEIGGGVVYRMGKPDPRIYQLALGLLGGLEASEVIAVGDSMEHDIAGAAAMGIDSIFIAGGIHKEALMGDGDVIDEASMAALCAEFGCTPTFVLPWFR